jgi:hypothetical protein
MKKIIGFLTTLLIALAANSQQEVNGLKQNFDITMDNKGDAMCEVSMKLNASQWDMFKKNLGNNTSILKREMEKALPKYFLSDFNYSEDAMDRSYTVKFKAQGLCIINKNGKWEGKLDSKNPDVTKLSDREFVINSNMVSDGVFIQQVQKIHLPSGAEGAKIEKDSFGKAILTYSTGEGGSSKLTLFGGIGLILAGGGLFFKNRMGAKNKLQAVDK